MVSTKNALLLCMASTPLPSFLSPDDENSVRQASYRLSHAWLRKRAHLRKITRDILAWRERRGWEHRLAQRHTDLLGLIRDILAREEEADAALEAVNKVD